MHLLYHIGDKIGLLHYEDALIFLSNEIKIPFNGDFLITACGKGVSNNAIIQLKVNGETVAQRNGELISFAGSFAAGDKILLDTFGLLDSILMLYEIE